MIIYVGIPTKPTIDQWRDYLAIQKSGVINMFNTNAIYCFSKHNLNRGVCRYIVNHYKELEKEFCLTIDDITDADIENLLIGSYNGLRCDI